VCASSILNVNSPPIFLAVTVSMAHNSLHPKRVRASLSLLVTSCTNVSLHRLEQFCRPTRHPRHHVARSIRRLELRLTRLQSSTPNR